MQIVCVRGAAAEVRRLHLPDASTIYGLDGAPDAVLVTGISAPIRCVCPHGFAEPGDPLAAACVCVRAVPWPLAVRNGRTGESITFYSPPLLLCSALAAGVGAALLTTPWSQAALVTIGMVACALALVTTRARVLLEHEQRH